MLVALTCTAAAACLTEAKANTRQLWQLTALAATSHLDLVSLADVLARNCAQQRLAGKEEGSVGMREMVIALWSKWIGES